jgi:hypothetical protein
MKLYPQGQRTLTLGDYQALMKQAEGKQSVLEFGPGNSTYAFIEAGVPKIVGLEHDQKWLDVAKERFRDYPQVRIDCYWNEAPEARVPDSLDYQRFDLAFVDSPKGYQSARLVHPGQEDCSRLNTCLAAIRLAPIVLLHDATRGLERASLMRLEQMGHAVDFVAWPTSGKFKSKDSYGIARITRDGKKQNRPDLSDAEKLGRPADGARPGGR